MFDFEGKTTVITGGSRGIGAATAILFAKLGSNVVFTYHKNEQQAKKIENTIKKIGGRALCFCLDLGDPNQISSVFHEIHDAFQEIDILVNNAAVYLGRSILQWTNKEIDLLYEVNLRGTINCIQQVVPGMVQQRWGRIINLASICGVIGCTDSSIYSMTKGGVISLTKALSKELISHGITVNAVAPGATATDMLLSLPEQEYNEIKNNIPMKKIATPEMIATGICYLASESATHITGTILHINGGVFG